MSYESRTVRQELQPVFKQAVRLSVIVPTYNEAENLKALIDALDSALTGIDYEIVISDDDSPDRTWALAEELAQCNPRLRVLRRVTNRGLSLAVVDGFSVARGEIVACIDADLQHDPGILPKMLEEVEAGSDLVVGSRYIPGGGTKNWRWHRRFASWAATKTAGWVVGIQLCDPMSGYFMLRRDDFARIRPYLKTNGFKILLDICSYLKPRKLREVPYVFGPRNAGESKLSGKVIFAYFEQLWRLSKQGSTLAASFTPENMPAAEAGSNAKSRRLAA